MKGTKMQETKNRGAVTKRVLDLVASCPWAESWVYQADDVNEEEQLRWLAKVVVHPEMGFTIPVCAEVYFEGGVPHLRIEKLEGKTFN